MWQGVEKGRAGARWSRQHTALGRRRVGVGSVGGSSGVAGARRGHVVRASGAPGVDLDDLAASRTEESKMPSGHAVAGGQHKLSARQPAPLQALMAAARERDRAHWLASPNWQPVHAAAWWWWWSFVRRPPSSPTRLCVPTNGTLRSPRARRRSGLTRVAWRTDTARVLVSGLVHRCLT